jgi:hypothetical protein
MPRSLPPVFVRAQVVAGLPPALHAALARLAARAAASPGRSHA